MFDSIACSFLPYALGFPGVLKHIGICELLLTDLKKLAYFAQEHDPSPCHTKKKLCF